MIICDYWESYFSFLIVDKILEPGFRDLIPLNDRSIGELQTYISGGSNTQMYYLSKKKSCNATEIFCNKIVFIMFCI